jgi:hypothetical protein
VVGQLSLELGYCAPVREIASIDRVTDSLQDARFDSSVGGPEVDERDTDLLRATQWISDLVGDGRGYSVSNVRYKVG